jgi:hypothetical protein
LPTVQGDCLSFDHFLSIRMVWPRPKYVGGRQVRDALVISQVIVVGDGPFNVAGNPTEFRGLDRCAAGTPLAAVVAMW